MAQKGQSEVRLFTRLIGEVVRHMVGGSRIQKRTSNGRNGKKNLSKEVVNVLQDWFKEHKHRPYPNKEQQVLPACLLVCVCASASAYAL